MTLPQPNQFDDFRRHVELRRECQRLHTEGERLFAAGDIDAAHELFARGVELGEISELLEERWKRRPTGSADPPERACAKAAWNCLGTHRKARRSFEPLIEIETVEQLVAHGYAVSTYCHACRRTGPLLDLKKYIDQGRGNLRPIDLGLKHKRCGRPLALTIHAAKGYGK